MAMSVGQVLNPVSSHVPSNAVTRVDFATDKRIGGPVTKSVPMRPELIGVHKQPEYGDVGLPRFELFNLLRG
jgi:hypothetical protein